VHYSYNIFWSYFFKFFIFHFYRQTRLQYFEKQLIMWNNLNNVLTSSRNKTKMLVSCRWWFSRNLIHVKQIVMMIVTTISFQRLKQELSERKCLLKSTVRNKMELNSNYSTILKIFNFLSLVAVSCRLGNLLFPSLLLLR